MIAVEPLTLHQALFVTLNLRPADRMEIHGLRADDNAVALAYEVTAAAAHSDLAWCVSWRGRPAAVLGAYEVRPGVWEAFAFGTSDWPRVALTVTRLALRSLTPELRRRGAHRVQAHSHIEHVEAHGWLRLVGASLEAHLSGYGRERADYLLFSWVE